jgi:hypothetical protein
MVRRLRNRLSNWTKAMLDRRYARSEQLGEVADAIRSLDERVSRLQTEIRALTGQVGPGDLFVGRGDPHEMRKQLSTASRLADECSRAIEQLLQTNILLRRDLDAVG